MKNFTKNISRKIPIAQVDAFTTKLFGGNPAGVVLDANALTETEMQHIAREMNLSETAFVLKSSRADFKLRYFTPVTEIRFCGHATVGTLHALAKLSYFNIKKGKDYNFKVETGAGILTMGVAYKSDDITISFDAPHTDLQQSQITHAELADAFEIDINSIDTSKPVMTEKETNEYIYFSIKSLDKLGKITYNSERVKLFSKKHSAILFCLLCTDTFDMKNNVHSRVFAPAVGLYEDPVTGSTQGGIAAYLLKNNLIPQDRKIIHSEQGNFINRPGEVTVEISKQDDILKAKIQAKAVMVFSTEIILNT